MNIIVATSTIKDGNMLLRDDPENSKIQSNRSSFLTKHGIDIEQTTLVKIDYKSCDYKKYYEVSEKHKNNGMYRDNIVVADALITKTPNHALFLPLADCVGVVIFDPTKNILMLSHLGRHSLEQNGGFESIKFLIRHYCCKPEKLKIWLSPAPGPDVYPMHDFNNRSIKNIISQQLHAAGIKKENIIDNQTDNSKDSNYYSHSEFLKGRQAEDGRYAVVAMMRKDDE